ncbi:MAG: hypothetical protein Udaeo2_31210 [Candidatus Udaeobacter sp.]|nr:MAG: hypothetical protein Udaeo2_31210 [Candidatus Udaeobacter sp.]
MRAIAGADKETTLPETGFTELSYQTANESPTGLYTFNVYLIKNNKRSSLLGSATAQVKEVSPRSHENRDALSKTAPAAGFIQGNARLRCAGQSLRHARNGSACNRQD